MLWLRFVANKKTAHMRFVGSQRCDCCHPAILCKRASSTKQLSGGRTNSANKQQYQKKSAFKQKPLRSGCAASCAFSDLLTYLALL
jgi:hypothetical protein